MAKLKRFGEYMVSFSKDPESFARKVAILENEQCSDVFESILEVTQTSSPIIVWKEGAKLNESKTHKRLPSRDDLLLGFNGEDFAPRSTNDRNKVKELNFPIVGISEGSRDSLKTIGKFKKSESKYAHFLEEVRPSSKFEAIVFKDEPIHIQENVNWVGFDVDQDRFKHVDSVGAIAKSVFEKYQPGFYKMGLLESNGKIYLDSVDNSSSLSPSQRASMYVKAYESFYDRKLPGWFKKKIFEDQVAPYYAKRYYDEMLLRPKYAKSLDKYAPKE